MRGTEGRRQGFSTGCKTADWSSGCSPTPRSIERVKNPPPDTRAWLRGRIVERFSQQVVGADWSYVKLQQIPHHVDSVVYQLEFPNPLMGTEQDMAEVWDQLQTPEQIFRYFRTGIAHLDRISRTVLTGF